MDGQIEIEIDNGDEQVALESRLLIRPGIWAYWSPLLEAYAKKKFSAETLPLAMEFFPPESAKKVDRFAAEN